MVERFQELGRVQGQVAGGMGGEEAAYCRVFDNIAESSFFILSGAVQDVSQTNCRPMVVILYSANLEEPL